MRILAISAALTLLAACGGGEGTGLTAEEDQALNEAAEMLDAAPGNAGPADETGLDNSAAPAAETGALPVTDDSATNGQ